MKTKVCNICDKRFPVSKFPFVNKKLGTTRGDCKACHASVVRKMYWDGVSKRGRLRDTTKVGQQLDGLINGMIDLRIRLDELLVENGNE